MTGVASAFGLFGAAIGLVMALAAVGFLIVCAPRGLIRIALTTLRSL